MDWWADVERALHAVPHAVAGAVATNAYAPERLTQDLDMAVLTVDIGRAEAALRVAGWRRLGALSFVRGSSWRDALEHDLDLIELTDSWARDAIAAAQDNRIAGMPTLPLRYLVLMKLVAARTTDLGDVSRMLGRASSEQVAEAREVVTGFGNDDDVIDFEQLVRLGRLEREFEPPDTSSEPRS